MHLSIHVSHKIHPIDVARVTASETPAIGSEHAPQ
jgi:hypothetical protein